MTKIAKQCTHGTCRSRAIAIAKVGFLTEASGRGGKGAYFWSGSYARVLAIGWYRQILAQGRLATESDSSGVVIYVIVEVDEADYLDFEDEDVKAGFARFIQKSGLNDETSAGRKAAAHDLFIKELEQELQVFKVIRMYLPAPGNNYCPEYPRTLMGTPVCYIVRSLDCVRIDRMERIA